MAHRIKKAIRRRKDRKTGDRLPSLGEISETFSPRLLVSPSIAAVLKRNPAIAAGLAAYAAAEMTEKYWGPPVEQQAQWTARQWEEYQDWYERNIRAQYAGSEIDPNSPLGYMPAPTRSMEMPEEPAKRTRKVTKANKATKMAWDILTKGRKAKLTKSACQKLLKKCSMMASKANPNTKSRIGTAKNGTTKACKKIRKTIWGTTKRY